MGRTSGVIRRGGWAIILALVVAAPVRADVTTERSSSILFFPKVISETPGIDTIIQISNTSNSMVFAHCLYVNAALEDISTFQPCSIPSATCMPAWQEVDFDIFLTKQQPTHWVVSSGRPIDPNDPRCTDTFHDCNNAGFDPGAIPPVAALFTGELKCVEVDSSGAPINGNHLKGEATIVTEDGDASKYNAVGVMGLNTLANTNNGDNVLCLGGGKTPNCPTGAEYNACPDTLIVNHFAAGASDPVIDEFTDGSTVTTELTLVPCTEDFEDQVPGQAVVQFRITNEFEELFSTSTTVTCWANFTLESVNRIFLEGNVGSRFLQTRLHPGSPDQSGVLGIVEEFHDLPGHQSRAALNLHMEGDRPNGDLIILPGAF